MRPMYLTYLWLWLWLFYGSKYNYCIALELLLLKAACNVGKKASQMESFLFGMPNI